MEKYFKYIGRGTEKCLQLSSGYRVLVKPGVPFAVPELYVQEMESMPHLYARCDKDGNDYDGAPEYIPAPDEAQAPAPKRKGAKKMEDDA